MTARSTSGPDRATSSAPSAQLWRALAVAALEIRRAGADDVSMRRTVSNFASPLCALAVSAVCAIGASAAQAASTAQSGQITGTVTALSAGQFTIQTPGRA